MNQALYNNVIVFNKNSLFTLIYSVMFRTTKLEFVPGDQSKDYQA